jgi:hypothetical protein
LPAAFFGRSHERDAPRVLVRLDAALHELLNLGHSSGEGLESCLGTTNALGV